MRAGTRRHGRVISSGSVSQRSAAHPPPSAWSGCAAHLQGSWFGVPIAAATFVACLWIAACGPADPADQPDPPAADVPDSAPNSDPATHPRHAIGPTDTLGAGPGEPLPALWARGERAAVRAAITTRLGPTASPSELAIELALVALAAGHKDFALHELRAAAPRAPHLWATIAWLEAERGRCGPALEAADRLGSGPHEGTVRVYERAGPAATWPTAILVALRLGAAHERCGVHQRAAEAYEAATKTSPERADAWLALGKARLATRQGAAAIAPLRRALALGADPLQAGAALGAALDDGCALDEALPLLEAAAAAKPPVPQAHERLCVLYGVLGRTDEARTACRAFLATEPPAPAAARARAQLGVLMLGPQQAAAELQAARARRCPSSPGGPGIR